MDAQSLRYCIIAQPQVDLWMLSHCVIASLPSHKWIYGC